MLRGGGGGGVEEGADQNQHQIRHRHHKGTAAEEVHIVSILFSFFL